MESEFLSSFVNYLKGYLIFSIVHTCALKLMTRALLVAFMTIANGFKN